MKKRVVNPNSPWRKKDSLGIGNKEIDTLHKANKWEEIQLRWRNCSRNSGNYKYISTPNRYKNNLGDV
jgi:hypothetical protein